MRSWKISQTIVCCMLACGIFISASDQAHADLVYTITGFANNIGDPNDPSLAPEVQAGETYTAVFEIDDSVADSDASAGRGSYAGAILSSSITFSGGYSSMVDFTGGEVVVQQDIAGGAIGLSDLSGNGSIVIASFTPFASDAIFAGPQDVIGNPFSIWSLTEPTGVVVSFSDVGFGPSGGSGPIVLSVTNAIPEPTTAGLLGLGLVACAARRRR